MTRITPMRREDCKEFETVFGITEVVMGFVPNSMLIMARDPDLLRAFSELSVVIMVRPGRLDSGLKALIMYAVSRSAGCQYCVAHSANLAGSHAIPVRKVENLWRYDESLEFTDAERAALRFAQAAGQVPNGVSDADFAELRRHFNEDQIIEIVAVVGFLGFLSRWNDTLATPLESIPKRFAQEHLSAGGWTLGKHDGARAGDPSTRRTETLGARVFLWLLRRFGSRILRK